AGGGGLDRLGVPRGRPAAALHPVAGADGDGRAGGAGQGGGAAECRPVHEGRGGGPGGGGAGRSGEVIHGVLALDRPQKRRTSEWPDCTGSLSRFLTSTEP